jgi:hypothetical protein
MWALEFVAHPDTLMIETSGQYPLFKVFLAKRNHKSITFVRNLSRLYCTQTTLHVSAIRPSSGVSHIFKNAKIIIII